jgi:hypothetical protein
MSRFRNVIRIFFVPVAVLFVFSSCEQIVEEALGEAIDCVFPHKPELRSEISDGKVDEPYSANITASIKNTPNEDEFDFEFEVMGSIPEGIQYTVFDRNLRFSGKPQEEGVFRFNVTVAIYDKREDSDGTCLGNNTLSEDYVIYIQP